MSRIFEALQRSESERMEFAFPEPSSVAMLDAAQKEAAEPEMGEIKAEPSPEDFPSVQVAPTPDSRLVALTEKEGLGAEKFRFLGVRLRQWQQERPLKKLLITSTLSEDGKTTVTANLAATLARRKQQKVLLLEGDLRRPMQAQLFGGSRPAGLSEWLQSGTRTVSNIYHLEGPGFWLMPAGLPPENPLELMQSGKLGRICWTNWPPGSTGW